MSALEFVVVEMNSPRLGRWADYSRCTASEALVFLSDHFPSDYRAKHWISGELLTFGQLREMTEEPEAWENKAPLKFSHSWVLRNSFQIGDGWKLTLVELQNGDTAYMPGSTKKHIQGPAFLMYQISGSGILCDQLGYAQYEEKKAKYGRVSE